MGTEELQLIQITNETDFHNITVGRSIFEDDIWDLTNIDTRNSVKRTERIIKFSYIKNSEIKFISKLYAYYKLGTSSVKTVNNAINCQLPAFIKFTEYSSIVSFSDIGKVQFVAFNEWLKEDYVIESNRNKGKHLSAKSGYYASHVVEDIIKIGQIKGWNVTRENIFNDIDSYKIWQPDHLEASTKTKPIPDDVYRKILYFAINKEEDLLTKSAIIIQSQTGLRISEILSLKSGCCKSTYEGHFYIEATITKTEKGMPYIHKVFCNDLVRNAIIELEKNTESLRAESGYKELFIQRSGKDIIVIKSSRFSQKRLNRFIKRWDIRDTKGNLYPLHSHQFRATFVKDLIRKKIPLEYIMKQFNHVSIEMTAHYLTLDQKEIKEIYADMILKPGSKTAGLRANEIRSSLEEKFKGKSEKEIDTVVQSLSNSMSFNPLPTGVCLYDFRRGNCTDGDGCFFYNCPNYLTEIQFYPVLKKELELMDIEMDRLKKLGMERNWQRQYVKWQYLKPLVDNLEDKLDET